MNLVLNLKYSCEYWDGKSYIVKSAILEGTGTATLQNAHGDQINTDLRSISWKSDSKRKLQPTLQTGGIQDLLHTSNRT